MDVQARDADTGWLRVFTLPTEPVVCTEEYVCECLPCRVVRSKLAVQGAGPSQLRVRPMSERHRKAA